MVTARVAAELDNDDTLIDVTGRVLDIRGRYGRRRGIEDFSAGSIRVRIVADGFLAPAGASGADHTAELAVGGVCEVWLRAGPASDERLAFGGRVESIDWRPSPAALTTATLVVVDGMSRLARAEVAVDLTAETTGARVGRILDAAGWPSTDSTTTARDIDTGTISCVADTEQATGSALSLLRRVAHTEGGRLAVAHGHRNGALRFAQRGPAGAGRATVTDMPAVASDLTFAVSPVLEQDLSLLVTGVEFTDGEGEVYTLSQSDIAARFGERTLTRSLYSDDDDTEGLATWYMSVYGQPLAYLRRIALALHLESALAADHALAVTVGDGVSVSYTTSDGDRITSYSVVDGVELRIRPLDMAAGEVAVDAVWSMHPPEEAVWWHVGETGFGELGTRTRLGPVASDHDRPALPGGRVRWESEQLVTAAAFGQGIGSQIVVRYDDAADRHDDRMPIDGQLSLLADTLTLWRCAHQSGLTLIAAPTTTT